MFLAWGDTSPSRFVLASRYFAAASSYCPELCSWFPSFFIICSTSLERQHRNTNVFSVCVCVCERGLARGRVEKIDTENGERAAGCAQLRACRAAAQACKGGKNEAERGWTHLSTADLVVCLRLELLLGRLCLLSDLLGGQALHCVEALRKVDAGRVSLAMTGTCRDGDVEAERGRGGGGGGGQSRSRLLCACACLGRRRAGIRLTARICSGVMPLIIACA